MKKKYFWIIERSKYSPIENPDYFCFFDMGDPKFSVKIDAKKYDNYEKAVEEGKSLIEYYCNHYSFTIEKIENKFFIPPAKIISRFELMDI